MKTMQKALDRIPEKLLDILITIAAFILVTLFYILMAVYLAAISLAFVVSWTPMLLGEIPFILVGLKAAYKLHMASMKTRARLKDAFRGVACKPFDALENMLKHAIILSWDEAQTRAAGT